jgi:hypothetical protein
VKGPGGPSRAFFYLEDLPGPFILWAIIKLGNNLINVDIIAPL